MCAKFARTRWSWSCVSILATILCMKILPTTLTSAATMMRCFQEVYSFQHYSWSPWVPRSTMATSVLPVHCGCSMSVQRSGSKRQRRHLCIHTMRLMNILVSITINAISIGLCKVRTCGLFYTKFKKFLHKEFKNDERGEVKISRHIERPKIVSSLRELWFGSTLRGDMSQNFLNATAEIFRLLCIGFLNLVLNRT